MTSQSLFLVLYSINTFDRSAQGTLCGAGYQIRSVMCEARPYPLYYVTGIITILIPAAVLLSMRYTLHISALTELVDKNSYKNSSKSGHVNIQMFFVNQISLAFWVYIIGRFY